MQGYTARTPGSAASALVDPEGVGLGKGETMKLLTLSVVWVVLIEVGVTLVMINASPHAPLGFWLWFGGIGVLSPFAGYCLYRWLTIAKA